MRGNKKIAKMFLISIILCVIIIAKKDAEAAFKDEHDYSIEFSKEADRVLYLNEDNDINNHFGENGFDEKVERDLFLRVVFLEHNCLDRLMNRKRNAHEAYENKIVKNLKWECSDESVVKLVNNFSAKKTEYYNINDETNYSEDNDALGYHRISCGDESSEDVRTSFNTDEAGNMTKEINISLELGTDERIIQVVGPGTAKITVTSPTLKQKRYIYITVKEDELYCPDTVYYTGNTYQTELRGGDKPVSYSSSDETIAKVDENGLITTKQKTGKCVISCLTESGQNHNLKIKVEKAGLNYTRQTGFIADDGANFGRSESYQSSVLIAKGIDVKKWKVSNKKIVKIIKTGSGNKIAVCVPKKAGKCTITCVAKDGKTYKCQYDVKHVKHWVRGIDEKEYKNLFCYKNVNKILDYGDVIECIAFHVDKKFRVRKGHEKVTAFGERELGDEFVSLLDERFEGKREVHGGYRGSFVNVPGPQLYYTVCYVE